MQTKSLNELIARLIDIRNQNDANGWSERNELPVFVSVDQGDTPTGRRRRRKWAPIKYAMSSIMSGIKVAGSVIELQGGEFYIELQAGEFYDKKKAIAEITGVLKDEHLLSN